MNSKKNRIEDKNANTINIVTTFTDQEWNFIFYAEFFKLCGIFPGKNLTFPSTIPHFRRPCQLEITKNRQWKKGCNELALLSYAIQDVYGESNTARELLILAEIYCKHDLLHACTFEEFPYYKTKQRLYDTLTKFENAYQEFENLKKKEGYHLQFFKISCQTKINFLLGQLRIKKRFDGMSLFICAKNLSLNYPPYSPYGLILGGIIFDQDLNYLINSENVYKYILKNFHLNPLLASYVFTRLGRFYNRILHENEISLLYFKKAIELAEQPYAFFKYAALTMDKAYIAPVDPDEIEPREIKQACYIFKKFILKLLQNKNLSPIQLEYLVTSCKILKETYEVYLNSNFPFYEELTKYVDNNEFFDYFFGSDSQAEKKNLKKHFNFI